MRVPWPCACALRNVCGAGSGPAVDFSHVRSDQILDLSSVRLLGDAVLSSLNTETLTTTGLVAPEDGRIYMNYFLAERVAMDVGLATRIVPVVERLRILKLIEDAAKDRNDYALANDAHYELQALEARQYAWPMRIVDVGVYRGMIRYFVRPLRPLIALLVLMWISSAVRVGVGSPRASARRKSRTVSTRSFSTTARTTDEPPPGVIGHTRRRLYRSLRASPSWSGRLWYQFVQTAEAAVRPRSPTPPRISRVEVWTYRALFACFLIALSADPTGRQFIDLLR
jgi:hypothetical protein